MATTTREDDAIRTSYEIDREEYLAVNHAADQVPRGSGLVSERIERIAEIAGVSPWTAAVVLGLATHPGAYRFRPAALDD